MSSAPARTRSYSPLKRPSAPAAEEETRRLPRARRVPHVSLARTAVPQEPAFTRADPSRRAALRRTEAQAPTHATGARLSVAHAPDGCAWNLQADVHRGRLQPGMQRRRRDGPAGSPLPPGDEAGSSPSADTVGGRLGNELHCGRKWAKVGIRMVMHRGTRVAGLLPPSHPGSDLGASMNNRFLSCPNDLRLVELAARSASSRPWMARARLITASPGVDVAPLRARPKVLATCARRPPLPRGDSSLNRFAPPHENP